MNHRKFTMISQKQQYLKQLKEKSFQSARKVGSLRQQLKKLIILVKFWTIIKRLNFKY